MGYWMEDYKNDTALYSIEHNPSNLSKWWVIWLETPPNNNKGWKVKKYRNLTVSHSLEIKVLIFHNLSCEGIHRHRDIFLSNWPFRI
jgi:hypothetical protein